MVIGDFGVKTGSVMQMLPDDVGRSGGGSSTHHIEEETVQRFSKNSAVVTKMQFATKMQYRLTANL